MAGRSAAALRGVQCKRLAAARALSNQAVVQAALATPLPRHCRAGAVSSSALDMHAWYRALFEDPERLGLTQGAPQLGTPRGLAPGMGPAPPRASAGGAMQWCDAAALHMHPPAPRRCCRWHCRSAEDVEEIATPRVAQAGPNGTAFYGCAPLPLLLLVRTPPRARRRRSAAPAPRRAVAAAALATGS